METLEIYKAILKEAQEGGYLNAIPEDEDEVVKEAEFYLQEANKAFENGMKGDKTIKAIRNLGTQIGEEVAEDIFGAPLDEKFHGLPVPRDPVNELTPLPTDFTEVGDKQLRRLHGEYNAYLARARWVLALAINKLSDATNMKEDVYRKAYLGARETEEKATNTVLDALARESEDYIKWERLVRDYQKDVTSYKALVEIYSGDIDRLSREWTMRTEEERRY